MNKRSLASKYLHFHVPDKFYIYDSRANLAAKQIAPPRRRLLEIEVDECDREYEGFVRQCIWIRDKIHEDYGFHATPREIDKLLLSV